tara:strand:+ start:56 stop:1021 length:966 start_codon:yes stop_codon:yes gene_type:complete
MKRSDIPIVYICPRCQTKLDITQKLGEKLYCSKCKNDFITNKNYIDFLTNSKLDGIAIQALETWGKDLHREGVENVSHFKNIKKRIGSRLNLMSGNIAEIGFGTGTDLEQIGSLEEIDHLIGVDIGENAYSVAKKLRGYTKISIIRADAQSLPLGNEQFDFVYSYGVIHHTKNPLKTLKECRRILKQNGLIYLYVYSNHSQNFIKKLGIIFEYLIMKILILLPRKFRVLFCIIITPVIWLIFTLPARSIKAIGMINTSQTIPFYWGKGPFSILPDIKDRFLSPVNHRFSKNTLNKMLEEANFECINSIEDSTGIYVAGKAK